MKHKVSEIEGALLDAAVAMASGWKAYVSERGQCFATVPDLEHGDGNGFVSFAPSRSWDDGGPVIERERITVSAHGSGAAWHADHFNTTRRACGPTPLIAGMRAFVASRFGDEVELP